MELKPGDCFSVYSANFLGEGITFIESIRGLTKESAQYSHSGFIIDDKNTTFEALYHYTEQNLYEAYGGQQIIIFRYKDMTPERFQKGFDAVKGNLGSVYPIYRLGLHLLGLAKYVHFEKPVCSETTEEMAIQAGMVTYTQGNWWGVSPWDLVCDWRITRYGDILFEGILPMEAK